MKLIIYYIFFLLMPVYIYSQVTVHSDLQGKLNGKEKFHDIKWIVLGHYEEKLSQLNANDSIERKNIMRQLKKWNRQFWIDEYYTNENGVGWVNKTGKGFYYFGEKQWKFWEGTLELDAQQDAKAYLQTLYDDFLRK